MLCCVQTVIIIGNHWLLLPWKLDDISELILYCALFSHTSVDYMVDINRQQQQRGTTFFFELYCVHLDDSSFKSFQLVNTNTSISVARVEPSSILFIDQILLNGFMLLSCASTVRALYTFYVSFVIFLCISFSHKSSHHHEQ